MCPVPEKMHVTTDAAAVRYSHAHGLEVLLIERANDPYRGHWALPGGFVDLEEDLADACARELREETGVQAAMMVQLGAWGKPGRDPRGRNVSVAYLAVVRPGEDEARGADDAARAVWHPAASLPPLAFDHEEIVAAGLARLRALAGATRIVLAFLPCSFGVEELGLALEAAAGRKHGLKEACLFADRAGLAVDARNGELSQPLPEGPDEYLSPLQGA